MKNGLSQIIPRKKIIRFFFGGGVKFTIIPLELLEQDISTNHQIHQYHN